MKMIKKLLVAVLAMAMVIGTMVVPSFAMTHEVKVTVDWSAVAEMDSVNAWVWGGDDGLGLNYCNDSWPGDALTKNDDGTWSGTFNVSENALCFIITANNEAYRTAEVDVSDSNTGEIKITVTKDTDEIDDFGTKKTVYVATGEAVGGSSESGNDTAAGDATSVMGYVVAGVVALAAVVTVISKKRSVEA